ncbi:terpene synthase [Striga asiatica]|uniref:Terpene synthase n=1 Tax=Striga asiatica TaxID=4170 RepID=A0A5A7P398_STRAF|nr:terpene synthase [Striga asiatica]
MEIVSTNHIVESHAVRRTADYKSNIWNYDDLMQLSHSNKLKYKEEIERLKEEVGRILGSSKDPIHKLELIDEIEKLALSYCFEEEIGNSVKEIAFGKTSTSLNMENDLYSAALQFKILRQHGYRVSQDSIIQLLDDETTRLDDKTKVEIFEASHLALEDECLLDRAKGFIAKNPNSNGDHQGKINVVPSHWSVSWFNAKKNINEPKKSTLHRLARLSFNMVQIQHQKELKDILRWWRSLGLPEAMTFARDRAVESFLWAVGVAYEPQYGSLRKWLSKAIMLLIVIDDLYDIYGSINELEQFTTAVEKWDPMETQHLPEAFKRCFWALYDVVNDMDLEIQKIKGWESVLPRLQEGWTGFCKALFVEAKWYHKGHSPSLEEYLDNGWKSSSGPLLSVHILLGVGHNITKTMDTLNNNQEIIHYASLIFRLCNDQGTTKAEQERGDAPSSILCYMQEANVTESQAREHVRNLIIESWKKMNGLFIKCPQSQRPEIRYVLNIARVAYFIYQDGDGCGVQDGETRKQVLSCLIDPLPLP